MNFDLNNLEISSNISQNLQNINFSINQVNYSVNPIRDNLSPKAKLVDFIRDRAHLKGTKGVCYQGGCGACIIVYKNKNEKFVKWVNSCLVSIWSIDGWEISTIESLGNFQDGYHEIQKKLVEHGGSQCGFCSPGMIMNIYGFLNQNADKKTDKDIEDAIDNICRCTGYRPILEAFKTSGKIETTSNSEIQGCSKCCQNTQDPKKFILKFANGQIWISVTNLIEFFNIFPKISGKKYRIMAGNTSLGIMQDDLYNYAFYIDILRVEDLKKIDLQENYMSFGANITIGGMIEILKNCNFAKFPYAENLMKHLKRCASISIRNLATIGGNLMLKFYKKSFVSDLFILLETIGGKILINTSPELTIELSPSEFFSQPPIFMSGKILTKIILPSISVQNSVVFFKSFKISRRFQNDGAIINAGFLFKFETNLISQKPSIVYGGINRNFIHAQKSENYLIGKNLRDAQVLKTAITILDGEIEPNFVPGGATTQYRKQLALNLFYKMVVFIFQNTLDVNLKSGGLDLEHRLTSSMQKYDQPDVKMYPLGQPVNKIEGQAQCAGEFEYLTDIPSTGNELFGAFVLSSVGRARIKFIDLSQALIVPGVVDFIGAKNVSGKNSCVVDIVPKFCPIVDEEEIFASKEVHYAGQAIGLICATSKEAAFEGVKRVRVIYENIQKPVLDFKEDSNQEIFENSENLQDCQENFEENFENLRNEVDFETTLNIKGQFKIGTQHHICLESCFCLAIPKENRQIEIFPSTQWMCYTHDVVAQALKIPQSSISIKARKLGGGFGLKLTHSNLVTTACSIAAFKTGKPVRVHLDWDTSMKMMGKRAPVLIKYQVQFDKKSGKIFKNSSHLTNDPGHSANESMNLYMSFYYQSCYKAENWEVKTEPFKTNTARNTWIRTPGGKEPMAMAENFMNHISKVCGIDPIQVRLANLIEKGDLIYPLKFKFDEENSLPKMIEELKISAEYEIRVAEIEKFNSENRWVKRGLGFACQRFPIALSTFFSGYTAIVSVYHQDGSVSIAHTAVEMGQGINTKCAQVVSHTLGIPLEKVKVQSMTNLIGTNLSPTGGSTSSNLATYNVQSACKNLLEKMKPTRDKFGGKPYTWEELVDQCWVDGVELSGFYILNPGDKLGYYGSYGAILTEVEIDVLTGENKIRRCDCIEDAGKSLNPKVDIGQIEGGLIYGFGHFLTEKVIYDEKTGAMLTASTFHYKVPMVKDIPEDFRVTLWKNDAEQVKGTLGAKGVGEGPTSLSSSVLFALRNAIDSARKDAGVPFEYFRMDTPVTPEDIVKFCLTSKDNLIF